MKQYEYYTYMLRCVDGSYYVGMTNDVTARVSQHQLGLDPKCYTFKRRPVTLVYNAYFSDVYEAISWEKHIKRWSRKKKEALIKGDEKALAELAECRNATSVFRDKKLRRMKYEIRDRFMSWFVRAHHDNINSSL